MAILTKEQILAANDLPRELVSVPEWGGEVYVKALSGAERDRFEASILSGKSKDQAVNLSNLRAKLAAASICDADGTRLFGDIDVQALGQKSAAALQRVFEVAQRLSGLGADAVKELAEELKANPLGGSPSA